MVGYMVMVAGEWELLGGIEDSLEWEFGTGAAEVENAGTSASDHLVCPQVGPSVGPTNISGRLC